MCVCVCLDNATMCIDFLLPGLSNLNYLPKITFLNIFYSHDLFPLPVHYDSGAIWHTWRYQIWKLIVHFYDYGVVNAIPDYLQLCISQPAASK